MTIVDVLERNSLKFTNNEAISEISYLNGKVKKSLSWKEFNSQSNQIANYLYENGIKKGDKIAIVMQNCIEWLPVFFGVLKVGAIAVPINHYMIKEDIEYCLNLVQCKGVIFTDNIRKKIECILKNSKLSICISVGNYNSTFSIRYNTIINTISTEYKKSKTDDEDYATIHFSSGTTGVPKAILHKHYSFIYSGIIEAFHRNAWPHSRQFSLAHACP